MSPHRTTIAQRIEDYFYSLRTELDHVREEIRSHHLLHADAFTAFNYIQPDENCLSDILADLLDPKGKHGQGDCFFHLLMQDLKVTLPGTVHPMKIYREEMTRYLTNPLRRMDILIDLGNFGIGIENKPWAKEQPDQVKDYLKHLGRQYGSNFVLAYLSGDGSGPVSVPIAELLRLEDTNQFRLLDYPTALRGWLERCVENCQADKVCLFLRDLGGYVKRYFSLAVSDWRTSSP